MSKAFTSEESDNEEYFEPPPLPPGVKNYMTVVGAQSFQVELDRLTFERQSLTGETVESRARQQTIDRRMRFLVARLDSAVIMDPSKQPKDRVLFGATVSYVDQTGQQQTWRIVGVDEADLTQNAISWMSPLATALFEKRVGNVVSFRDQRLTIKSIS